MVLIFTLSSYMIDYVLHARLQVGSYMIVCVMRFMPDMKSGYSGEKVKIVKVKIVVFYAILIPFLLNFSLLCNK